ncbi:MAG: hypothetical protein A2095_04165 [Sphingomonadales bacterium GWF1_63_6]|nr:MAG: hypothetical protein A2095_04165 [Sphingomonadales bacterium GWF1_63_6]
MTVREHEAVVAEKNGAIDRLASQLRDGDREISQLKADVTAAEMAYLESHKGHQRVAAELATLKAERDDCQVQKDEGATYVLKSLADALHVEDWSIKDGSEEWEGDVFATMFSILVDAGVVEEDHHTVATHAKIIGLERAISSLTPDALKYRERLRRDREALAAKRKRAVAALPNAQAARGGDVREGV